MNNKKEKISKTIDNIEKIIEKSLITLFLILLLLSWGIIPIIICTILKIDYQNLNNIIKTILLVINDSLLLLLLSLIYKKTLKKDLAELKNKQKRKQYFFFSVKCWIIGLIIMVISNSIIAILTNGTLAANEQEVRKLIDSYPLYMLFQLAIYAPLTEELIFRKSIKDITKNKYLYLFLTGLIFGSLHVLSSLKTPLDLLYLIPYCSLGATFGYIYYKTNNIYSTITIHAIHNTFAFILYLLTTVIS